MLFGDQTVESNLDSNVAGLPEAFPFTNAAAGTASSIVVYLDSHSRASQIVAGLYSSSNGHPGTLLVAGLLSAPKAGAWNTVPIASTAVPAGSYWLALLGKGGTVYFRDRLNGPCFSQNTPAGGYRALASVWKRGPNWKTCPISAYVIDPPASAPAPPPVVLPPVNTAAPSVSGTAVDGDTLTASPGTWANSPTSFGYQWQDCSTGSLGLVCSNIAGATANSYKLTKSDAGSTMRVVVTGSNSGGSTPADSPQTGVVALPPAPQNSTPPAVSGTAAQGQTLSTNNGSWSNNPTGYGYGWEDCDSSGANCTTITGASAASYTLGSGDLGHTIRAVVTATNDGGSGSQASAPTAPVKAPAPSNTALPTVSGQTVQGKALTVNNGSWTGSPTSYGYAWQDCNSSGASCTTITGASAASYTLGSGDVGHTIRAIVTATNAGGSTPATSGATAQVTGTGTPPSNTALPLVSGQTVQGDQLSTSNGTWAGSPTSYAYAWQDCDTSGANCSAIAGATSSSYTLAAADVGHTIRSVVTASNSNGSGQPATSASVGPVTSASSAGCTGTPNTPGGPDPWGGCFPGPNNTGVPAGTTLTNVPGQATSGSGWTWNSSGGYVNVTSCGVTLNALHIAGGLTLASSASNGTTSASTPCVTVNNSEIDGEVAVQGLSANIAGGPLVMHHDKVVDQYDRMAAPLTSNNWFVYNVYVYGGRLGLTCYVGPCAAQDSYTCCGYLSSSSTSVFHYNAFGIDASNVSSEHNTLECSFFAIDNANVKQGAGCSTNISIFGDFNPINNITIDKNLLVSNPTGFPGYTEVAPGTFCTNLGNNTGKQYHTPNHITFTNNVFQRGSWGSPGHCGFSGPVTAWYADPTNVFTGNTYDDGTAVSP